MIERAISLALIPPWLACASGFVFFSGVGMLTEAVLGSEDLLEEVERLTEELAEVEEELRLIKDEE